MVERQQRNADGTWTLSDHTSGTVMVLEHAITLDELYDGVAPWLSPVSSTEADATGRTPLAAGLPSRRPSRV